jgi:adenosylhomocysteine nucleosidase
MAGRNVVSWSTDSLTVVAARCGAGIVNAVITAQALTDRFQPGLLVSVGLCAAVDDALSIGDLVLVDSFDRHDIGTHTDAGFIHGTAWYRKTHFDAAKLAGEKTDWPTFVALSTNRIVPSIHRVVLATGDSFIRSPMKRSWIRQKLGAQVVDMSGAAIAATAAANGTPLVVLRKVSDYGDAAAGGTFAASADEEATDLVGAAFAFIQTWSERGEGTW